MGEELKPCPNCESIRVKVSPPNFNGFSYAWCVFCGVRGPVAEVGPEDDQRYYDDVIRKWNSLPRARPLAWTKERPTEPGWYWCRRKGAEEPTTVFLEPGDIEDDDPTFASHFFAPREWAGPIPEPKEAS